MANKTIDLAKELLEKGEDFVIAKVVDTYGSAPRKIGAWLLMTASGRQMGTVGGGKLEAEAEKLAKAAFTTKESKIHRFSLTPEEAGGIDMRCGGDVDISIEYIEAKNAKAFIDEFHIGDTAYIFGGGHVGFALEPVLRHIGFETVVIDDREEFANKDRFAFAREVHVIDSYDKCFKNIETDDNSYIVIVTRGHAGDYDVLKQALVRKNAYIGMIGSKSKVAGTFARLEEEEKIEKEKIEKVYTPIGVSIHAETPEEIAISIAGEMIQVRAGYGRL